MNDAPQSLLDTFKETVKGWVPKVRDVLDKDFAAELKRLGIPPTGKPVPLEKMSLPEDDRKIRIRIGALLHRESLSEGSEQKGYENVRRELSYTCLNRLVGLKCMETRGLLYLPPPDDPQAEPEETRIISHIEGQRWSLFLRDVRAAGASKYKYDDNAEEALLRDGLTAAYRFITSEIRILFDPDHEYACLWPTYGCLVKVIGMINSDLPEDVYRAQDFLGWVYQFFNREEKKKVRDENKGTPRSSYELSVINQFYTPSWVVKALVDNTLGRLWLQMHPDSSIHPAGPPPLPGEGNWYQPVANYLVPNTGEKIRYERLTESGQIETFKKAADIALLDPACGTMHFGQYAFGLFHRMYLDEIEHAGEPGWPTEPSVSGPKEIPAAIIERNLYGVDIDARAIQIASLSLLLTAKEAAAASGYSPLDVRLRRSNLVVANAVNIGEQNLRSIVDGLGERLGSRSLQEALFKAIWENLQNVGELGSLIRVHESVSCVLDQWTERQARVKGLTRVRAPKEDGQLMLETLAEFEQSQRKQLELERVVIGEEAEQMRQELLTALEEATRREVDPTQRLFAEDTARGLKLLQVLSRRYDVIVMNPPYGSFIPRVRDLAESPYNDIDAAMVSRGTQLSHRESYVGALVPRNFVAKSRGRMKDFRTQVLLKSNPLILMVDLGLGILDDATVETAAIVLAGGSGLRSGRIRAELDAVNPLRNMEGDTPVATTRKITFIDLTGASQPKLELNGREGRLVRTLRGEQDGIRFDIHGHEFTEIDGAPLAYRRIGVVAPVFRKFPALAPEWGIAAQGHATTNDPRFVRMRWEVLACDVGPGKKWSRFAKGGEFSRFYSDVYLVVQWDDEAHVEYAKRESNFNVLLTSNRAKYLYRPGLTWPRAASIFNVRIMPTDCIFSHQGPVVFPHNESSTTLFLAAILNSTCALYLMKCLTSRESMGGRWEVGIVKRLPIPTPTLNQNSALSALAKSIWASKAAWDECEEISSSFRTPLLLCQKFAGDSQAISERLNRLAEFESNENRQIQSYYGHLNDLVFELYGIPEIVKAEINETLGVCQPEVLWPQMAGKTPEQKRMESVWRLLSFAVKRVVEVDEDGIAPFSGVSGKIPLLDQVRSEVAAMFPCCDLNQLEIELSNELKRKVKGYDRVESIGDWLENIYFGHHASMYKDRPIFWHISSKQGKGPAAFSALVHYHRFDKDRIAKLRGVYLREVLNNFRREAALAGQAGRADDRLDWQSKVEEAEELDRRLQKLQEGFHQGGEDFRILTPWKAEGERPKGWNPDIDDGVKVNIEPLQRAGVLRIPEVV